MKSGWSSLNGKLSNLSVEGSFMPNIAQSLENTGSVRRTGDLHSQADLVGEEEFSIVLEETMSVVKALPLEEEEDSTTARKTSCSFSLAQKRKESDAALCIEPSDGPPDGFVYIFPYVELNSLLTLERVSKPMRSGVNDVLVWKKLHVEPPLSKALSDEILLTLVMRGKGNLRSLRLVECFRITDAGLANVLSLSPQLEKLYIPGCTSLTADALVNMVEQYCKERRSKGMSGIKQLRVRGIYNIRHQHLNALRSIVLSGNGNQAVSTKPVYWNADPVPIVDDERAIDVEICPRCKGENATVVYDCTRESCQNVGKLEPSKACRGCMMCLPRCVGCGTCLLTDEFERTCCTDLVCLTCWLHLSKCSECNNAFCRRHTEKFNVRNPDDRVICEDCLYGHCDEGTDLEIVGGNSTAPG